MSRTLTMKTIASLAFALIATAAFAHAQLQKAVPAAGATVSASPGEIRLKFSEGVEPRFSNIALATQQGAAQPIGKPSVDPADNSVLVATIAQQLKPGVYKVTWRAVSVDTHKTQGSFAFTVAP
jgi:methionine-rich copper-binding protein CopC